MFFFSLTNSSLKVPFFLLYSLYDQGYGNQAETVLSVMIVDKPVQLGKSPNWSVSAD